ncbi:hypothetical protein ABCR94_16250 [Streptomyces sp. 21So2-11]|uniref:aromatic-ring hydroxylase C-terminal domain-containing protein n=1 Tax=Streptomyces sp. 21So2-11 TaxID=3144408 RepID=UPI00321BE595
MAAGPQGRGTDGEPVNRLLARRVSALDTTYPPSVRDSHPLVGQRMPDIGLTAAGTDEKRAYELFREGQFVLFDLAPEVPATGASPGRVGTECAPHVRTVVVTDHETHTALDGLADLLVRPDGHIAWAAGHLDPETRQAERAAALAAWTGKS